VAGPDFSSCPVIIPYYGGKFELSRRLVPMLPPHERYIETFAGGLSMFFRKKKTIWNVVNDIDNDIVNLYITILERFDEFADNVYWIPRGRELYTRFKAEIMDGKVIDIPNPKRASHYYFLIRNSFNKNPYGVFSKTPKSEWRHKLLEELKYSRTYFENTTIENLDFRMLFKKYPPRPIDCWYFDPPYVVAGERGDYYMHQFDWDMHNGLKEICDSINEAGGKFMVSYDNRDEIREIYKDYNVDDIQTKYAGAKSARSKIFTELVIMNYEPPSVQETLWKGGEDG